MRRQSGELGASRAWPRPYIRRLTSFDVQRAVGCRNGAELWRELKQQGFRGCPSGGRGMGRAAAREGRHWRHLPRSFGANHARLMTIGRDGLSKSETVVAAIERGAPSLVQPAGAPARSGAGGLEARNPGPRSPRSSVRLVERWIGGLAADQVRQGPQDQPRGRGGRPEGGANLAVVWIVNHDFLDRRKGEIPPMAVNHDG